jgi:hypothetical protein
MVRARRRAGWKARWRNVSRSGRNTCSQSPAMGPACGCTGTRRRASGNARLTAARAAPEGAGPRSAASAAIVAASQRNSPWQWGQPERCFSTRITSAGSSRPSAKSASCSSPRWVLLSSLIPTPTEEEGHRRADSLSQRWSSRMVRSFSKQRARMGPIEPVASPSFSAISA